MTIRTTALAALVGALAVLPLGAGVAGAAVRAEAPAAAAPAASAAQAALAEATRVAGGYGYGHYRGHWRDRRHGYRKGYRRGFRHGYREGLRDGRHRWKPRRWYRRHDGYGRHGPDARLYIRGPHFGFGYWSH